MHNVCLSENDLIGLCETSLSPNLDKSKLGLYNHDTYHCDRNPKYK